MADAEGNDVQSDNSADSAGKLIASLRLIGVLYFVLGTLLALAALLVSLTVVPALLYAVPEFSVGWPKLMLVWILSIVVFVTGRRLRAQRSLVFCSVVAGAVFLMFPIGTALSVPTIILLRRPDVGVMFRNGGSGHVILLALAGAFGLVLAVASASALSMWLSGSA